MFLTLARVTVGNKVRAASTAKNKLNLIMLASL